MSTYAPSSRLLYGLSHVFPAVLNFYLDSRWGLHADRLVVSKEQRGARSIPGLSLLQAADHALTSCHLTSDLLVGDVAITQGRHYWACSVEPGSYLVKVRTFYRIYFLYLMLCMMMDYTICIHEHV